MSETYPHVITQWHDMLKNQDFSSIGQWLSDDVVFWSPVIHSAIQGKLMTSFYLNAALSVFANDSFRYVREMIGPHDAVLEFMTEIEGIQINGVDMITWNDAGQVTEFKVMLRPLKAIQLIHQKMGEMLKATASGS